jgi:hypothetical protein
MHKSLEFKGDQLHWLEELPQDYFVELRAQEQGQGSFDADRTLFHQILSLKELPLVVRANPDKNLWRSWEVFRDREKRNRIGPVPLILDIDDESDPPNLSNAFQFTGICLDLLETKDHFSQSGSLRVVFSGRKGFHIEAKSLIPFDAELLRKELLRDCQDRCACVYPNGNVFIDGVVLDTFHPWVRVTGAVHTWRAPDGSLIARRAIQMSVPEFRRKTVAEVSSLAEVT